MRDRTLFHRERLEEPQPLLHLRQDSSVHHVPPSATSAGREADRHVMRLQADKIIQLCTEARGALHAVDEDDPIHECRVDLGGLQDDPAELLSLAERQLNVFPFKDVRFCWFRLFTDASIARAVQAIRYAAEPGGNEVETQPGGEIHLEHKDKDEVISLLDMALIMAGGVGREALIHRLLSGLAKAELGGPSLGADDMAGGRARKGTVLEPDVLEDSLHYPSGCADSGDLIPLKPTMLPVIRFPVSKVTRPSLTEFQKHMDKIKEPVVLEGTMDYWPALEQWKRKSYWMRHTFNGRRLVPVEVGRTYTDDDWSQKIMSFGDFFDEHILMTCGGKGNSSNPSPATGYLAQHDLLQQIPSLGSAIATPDYCFLDPPRPEPGTPVYNSQLRSRNAAKDGTSEADRSHSRGLQTNTSRTTAAATDTGLIDQSSRHSNQERCRNNIGHGNSGNNNIGNYNSGDNNIGDYNTGDGNVGNNNGGDRNQGNYNTGNSNHGNNNAGDDNHGNYNAGNSNNGNYNQGDYNNGNNNIGDHHNGNNHSSTIRNQQRDHSDDHTVFDAPETVIKKNIWLGPPWTITPLHHDQYHNILSQVVGWKYVRLYSPHHSHRLFPRSSTEPAPHQPHHQPHQQRSKEKHEAGSSSCSSSMDMPTIDLSNTSRIDISLTELSPAEDWDAVYPDFSTVPYVECVLEPGQALYIPVGWWHYVRSCSVAASVSFWWGWEK